ncbi:MAG: hypothetical protein GDA42_01910 [Ekhidna sp.]|nr:hypothetical protein [Ekhidna sp.]
MKKISLLVITVVVLTSCSSPSNENDRPVTSTDSPDISSAVWIGNWKAEWETPPDSYPDLKDMEFYMNGRFVFSKDSLTVINNGYPGCIFAADTLKHTQSWKVSNDTLVSYNDTSTPGMIYKVKSLSENGIELQLMEDIFVTLTK